MGCVMKVTILLTLCIYLTATLGVGPRKKLIKTEFEVLELSNDEVQNLAARNPHFMDISYGAELRKNGNLSMVKFPTKLGEYRAPAIWSLIDGVDKKLMKKHFDKLASFCKKDRKPKTGRESAEWIFRMIKHLTKDSPLKVTTQRIIHKGWPQFSILCRIEPPDKNLPLSKTDRVVLSAHLDDGPSAVAQLETLRLVASTAMKMTRPIEFLFFSAEKAGLLGSQSVVRHYQEHNISVAVLHTDINCNIASSTTTGIGLIRDNTDHRMNKLLRSLIKSYSTLPVRRVKCGYAGSDHYSWHIAGYPVAGLFSGTASQRNVPTLSETVQTVNFDHVKEFVKVALSYALHMTDPEVHYH